MGTCGVRTAMDIYNQIFYLVSLSKIEDRKKILYTQVSTHIMYLGTLNTKKLNVGPHRELNPGPLTCSVSSSEPELATQSENHTSRPCGQH